ncbi:hypothetical protein M422DRAFT_259184 [Sphaerobolus stellatus SS14]|uniref:Uncharacterized protein n=1 Tax=Sphaerobolus stellatus (strain SS14) TaxID=990650 RepID=A0A0C9VKJ2_SPHS4|nr:hypothetical protein M422DRAFT_259184 [Sphaerobolus stellatus SS14]
MAAFDFVGRIWRIHGALSLPERFKCLASMTNLRECYLHIPGRGIETLLESLPPLIERFYLECDTREVLKTLESGQLSYLSPLRRLQHLTHFGNIIVIEPQFWVKAAKKVLRTICEETHPSLRHISISPPPYLSSGLDSYCRNVKKIFPRSGAWLWLNRDEHDGSFVGYVEQNVLVSQTFAWIQPDSEPW